MLKKILYSFMAVTFALMPVSEAFATDYTRIEGPTTIGADDVYTINGQGESQWVSDGNSKVTNTGGELSLKGITVTDTVGTPNYKQTGAEARFSLFSGANMTLVGVEGNNAGITAGRVMVGDYEGGTPTTGNTLTLGNYSEIGNGVVLVVNKGNTLTLNTANSTLNFADNSYVTEEGPLYSSWTGTVNLSNGTFNYSMAKNQLGSDTGILNATGGNLNVIKSSDGKASELIFTSGSTLADTTKVNVETGNTLTYAGSGTETFSIGSDDKIDGTLNYASGTATVKQGGTIATALANGTLGVSGGTVKLEDFDGSNKNPKINATSGNLDITGSDVLTVGAGSNVKVGNGTTGVDLITTIPNKESATAPLVGSRITVDGTSSAAGALTLDSGSNVQAIVTNTGYGVVNVDNGGKFNSSKNVYSTFSQDSANATLNVNNGEMNLYGWSETTSPITYHDSDISKGKVNVGKGTESSTVATINIGDGGIIRKEAIVDLKKDGRINLKDSAYGSYSMSLDNDDNWDGLIVSETDGVLYLEGYTEGKGTNGVLQQISGTLTLTDGSKFTLANVKDSIKGGKVLIGTGLGSSDVNNELHIAIKSTEEGVTETLAKAAQVKIESGNTLKFSGDGNGIIDGVAGTRDAWNGNISLEGTSAELTLDSRSGSYADTTTATKTYNQIAGTLNLDNGSYLSLATKESGISDGTVNIKNSSQMVFDNGLENSAKIVMNNTTGGGSLTVKGNGGTSNPTKLNALNGTDLSKGKVTLGDNTNANVMQMQTGSTLAGTVTTTLNKKSTLDIAGGNVTLNGTRVVYDPATGLRTTETTAASDVPNSDVWNGNVTMSSGSLTLDDASKYIGEGSTYSQTGGTLNVTNGSALALTGEDIAPSKIIGGKVVVGKDATDTAAIEVSRGGQIGANAEGTSKAQVVINEMGNAILSGSLGDGTPSLLLSNYTNDATKDDVWKGTIYNHSDGILKLSGFENLTPASGSQGLKYIQEGGTLNINSAEGNISYLKLSTPESYISGGIVHIFDGTTDPNVLTIAEHTTATDASGNPLEATLGNDARVGIDQNAWLMVGGNGTAVLNDSAADSTAIGHDSWNGLVTLGLMDNGSGGYVTDNTSVLTLRNVQKDFTNVGESAQLSQQGGTLNIYANERGGSDLTYGTEVATDGSIVVPQYQGGQINIQGYDASKLSRLTLNYNDVDAAGTPFTHTTQLNAQMQGNAEYVINTNQHTVNHTNAYPSGIGPNNTLVKKGSGTYNVINPGKDLNMGYNVRVEEGTMTVDANSMTIGTDDGTGRLYGDLQIGRNNPVSTTHFYTNALNNQILGNLIMHDGWYHVTNPNGHTSVVGNMSVGSGIDMMQGAINSIDVNGVNTVSNLKLKIDVDPATYRADSINAAGVVATDNSVLDLVDYNLLSTPRANKYTFRVVNAQNENYAIGNNAQKIVTQNKITWTPVGGYQMIPSSVKGAFDMVLTQYNPQIFRGQVAADVIYANQLAITNQVFDRMFYSNLPYFNGDCSNKTASANTLFSPYQYSNNDTGLWFKPYANFEKIHMNYGVNVNNISYGALIGADFAKKKMGAWSFIPSAYVGYNGGRSTYSGVGMWHNGGQAGFMGTFTHKDDFITAFTAYAGGYHNVMDVAGYHDTNALWNAGVASKSAYNIHLPWDFILQPTLYMAYNYVGASAIDSNYGNLFYKIDPLNAFSIAPGVNLIWQKETFSIYAMFQTMFSINAYTSGTVAEIDLPHVGIRDPYFEYGLGVSKFFKDRFSGYAQAVARSGSRKGIGFQLGMNMKL